MVSACFQLDIVTVVFKLQPLYYCSPEWRSAQGFVFVTFTSQHVKVKCELMQNISYSTEED